MRGELKGNVARNVAVAHGAGRTTPWVGHWARNAELGGWRKTQFGQGVIPGKLLSGGIREGTEGNAVRPMATSSATAPRKLRCNGKRPVCCCSETGACQSCGAAACVQQLRRSRGEAAGACCSLQPQSEESAKRVNRSADYAEGVWDSGETVLFLAATSRQWDFREFRVRCG